MCDSVCLQSVLTEAHYSVWIDEAGIRAGQNWRNEIADGIQGCGIFLFLLSKRSANSQYCHNEVDVWVWLTKSFPKSS